MEQFQEIDKALAVIKPAEQRIVGWQKVLPPIFNWENESLLELKKYDEGGEFDISKLIIKNPTKHDIPKLKEIDDMMQKLNKLAKVKETERKEVFKNVTDLGKRLMVPEKTFASLVDALKPTFISIAKIKKEEQDKEERRNQDLTNFRTKCQTYFNNFQASQNTYIQEKVTQVYKDALELIELDDAQAYLDDITSKHQADAFKILNPSFSESEISDKDKVDIWNSIRETWDASKFVIYFDNLLSQTFSDFSNAKLQKEVAIQQREAEQVIEVAEISENLEMENTLAVIDEKAAPVQSQSSFFEPTRELKKVYQIDMEHTEANMRIINKAFYQNMKECLAVWQGKDCWSISTIDQGNLLSKLKNKDNVFQPEGVKFKEVDKI